MKKKTYKAMLNKCARTISRELYQARETVQVAEDAKKSAIVAKERAESKADWYMERFRKIGSKFDSIPADPFAVVKWEIDPKQWGTYAVLNHMEQESVLFEMFKRDIVEKLVNGLMEQNLVQFIYKGRDDCSPLDYPTMGVKLYVIPWEQVPYRNKIELTTWMYNERVKWGRMEYGQ